jgi:class 3 adenylate cyclase
MNATARLEHATREPGCRFLVSEEALRALGPVHGLRLRDMGALALRGRQESLRAWAVEPAAAVSPRDHSQRPAHAAG